MYYNSKKLILNVLWLIIGITLITLKLTGIISSTICACMGCSFFAIGALQIIRIIKYHSDNEYREKVDIVHSDERNQYIHVKALAIAGYLFIASAGIVSIILYFINLTTYAQIISYCICSMLIFYLITYVILQRKY